MKKTICFFSIGAFFLFMNLISIKCEEMPFSLIKIYIANNTMKMNSPIDVWFNDSLVISKEIIGNYGVVYKLFSKGSLKVTSQIRDLISTRSEYTLNILDDKSYIVVITFESTKYPASIFSIKKTDGVNYEAYFEENIFQLTDVENDSLYKV